jgi:hypothetical protein
VVSRAEVIVEFIDDGAKRTVEIAAPVRHSRTSNGLIRSKEFVLGFSRDARRAGKEASGIGYLRCGTDGKVELTSVVDIEQGAWIEGSLRKGLHLFACEARSAPYCITMALNFCLGKGANYPTANCKASREADRESEPAK